MEADTNKKTRGGRKHKRKPRGPSLSTVILVIAFIAGAALVAYPTASDAWNSAHAVRAISDYSDQVENLEQEQIDAMFQAAEEYNSRLLNGTDFSLDDEEMEEYMSLLDLTSSGIMGYIQIPSINVNLPIYHTVEEDVLQTAVGHIPGTSLPVGGERTHAALSAHRGLPSARLFTDLDKLSEGDVFTIHILDRTFTYQIDQIRIVIPQETEELAIKPGRDYVTLVTCTPYGVNSHRMLVRGTRIENLAGDVEVKAEAEKIPGYVMIPFAMAPILIVALAATFAVTSVTGKKRSKKAMLRDIDANGIELDEDPGADKGKETDVIDDTEENKNLEGEEGHEKED